MAHHSRRSPAATVNRASDRAATLRELAIAPTLNPSAWTIVGNEVGVRVLHQHTTFKDIVMDNIDGSPDLNSANDATRDIKESVSSLADTAKKAVAREADAGIQRASDTAKDLAATLRNAANGVSDDESWIATLLNKSAEGVDRATRSLADGDFSGVLTDVNGFARRQPALFLGACVALGFAAARVGKTAIEQHSTTEPSADDPRSL